jgi:hypothetical protein
VRDVAGGRDVGGGLGRPTRGTHPRPGRIRRPLRGCRRGADDGLLEGGVDLLIETASTLEELLLILATIRARTDPAGAGRDDLREELVAVDGTTPRRRRQVLTAAAADAPGCLEALTRMAEATTVRC